MIRRHIGVLLLLGYGLLGITAKAQPQGQPVQIGQAFSLFSRVLEEHRPYYVYLPDAYDAQGAPLPVLYLLDGGEHFHHASGIVDFLIAQGKMPPLIMIGIQTTENRMRDLTPPLIRYPVDSTRFPDAGGADKLLTFFSQELIPHIDSAYHTNAYRLLVGHSLGGLFAIRTFLQTPGLCNGYIAISPSLWWDKEAVVHRARNLLPGSSRHRGHLFITLGNEGGEMLEAVQNWVDLLEEQANPQFDWRYHRFEEEDHGSVPHLSIYKGLEYIFHDLFQANMAKLYAKGGMQAIDQHYRELSEAFGYIYVPSEQELNTLGYSLLRKGKFTEAQQVFEENIRRFPHSYNVYDSMAEVLMEKGDPGAAISYYIQSLSIHPGNDNGIFMLEKLGIAYDPSDHYVKLEPHNLALFAGDYEVPGLGYMQIALDNERLSICSSEGLPPQELKPCGDNRFVMEPFGALMVFEQEGPHEISGFSAQVGPGQYAYGTRVR